MPAQAKAGAPPRDAALRLLGSVLDKKKPLDATLAREPLVAALSPRDRAFARAITATTLRRLGQIDAALDAVLESRPDSQKLIRILQLAIAQLLFMGAADHAAVSLAVDSVAADRKLSRYKGLANAVLRRIGREKKRFAANEDAGRINTPDWLWTRWCDIYGEEAAAAITSAHLNEPYVDLSVRGDPDTVAAALGAKVLPTGSLRLALSGPVESLPGYDDGTWWVQDAAAAIPARLLGDIAGLDVADLCAAPGGKAAQLAAAGARVVAVDQSAPRLARLKTNLDRLNLTAETVASDVMTWKPGRLFDAILLDAPCSATGTIRRHPDVARLKKPEDIQGLAALQARMIGRAATLLKPGGVLVYCTCSLEAEEGERHVSAAVDQTGLTLSPIEAGELEGLESAVTPEGTLRTLPSHLPMDDTRLSGLDGFFAMRLRKPDDSVEQSAIARETLKGDSPHQ